MKIKAIIRPNIEEDVQTFSLADLGLTRDEWCAMDEEDQKMLLYEVVADNLYGIVDEIIEV